MIMADKPIARNENLSLDSTLSSLIISKSKKILLFKKYVVQFLNVILKIFPRLKSNQSESGILVISICIHDDYEYQIGNRNSSESK